MVESATAAVVVEAAVEAVVEAVVEAAAAVAPSPTADASNAALSRSS